MNTVVIVAGGQSTRMGPGVDKLFLPVAQRPLIAHTWGNFDACPAIDHVVVVVRQGREEACRNLAVQYQFAKPFDIAVGGAARQDSVWNGLEVVPKQTEVVLIQDAARPCTARQLILDSIGAAREVGAAVAAQRVTDTIKESEDGALIRRNIDRSRLWSVQTPQAFRLEIIRRALSAVRQKGLQITDDTAACELIGQEVRLVESREPNPKATSPADLPLIELLLARRSPSTYE